MAEAFGKSNTSQIIDMKGNNGDVNTPQYAIYENGKLAKVALFNFMTDPTGAHDYTAALHLNGAGAVVPAQVHVKYVHAFYMYTSSKPSKISYRFICLSESGYALGWSGKVIQFQDAPRAHLCPRPSVTDSRPTAVFKGS